MSSCNKYNQYYTDIVDTNGNIVTSKCFDGAFYLDAKGYDVNNYKTYKSSDYYSWINEHFKEYSFPEEDYESDEYSPEASFKNICESKVYSLKQQQKFAGRIFNTYTDINGMLIYHGLGSGKTQTSIVIGEAFKFRKTDNAIIPGRENTRVLIVVPAALQAQYYAEIIGKYEDGTIKSAPGEIVISGDRQYYSSKIVRSTLTGIFEKIAQKRQRKFDLTNASSVNAKEVLALQNEIDALITETKDLQIDENVRVTRVYEILSHETFLNKLFIIKDNKYEPQGYLKLLEKPGGLLIIDEIQNLISATGTNYRRLLFALNFYSKPGFRTVLLTGTPVYDKPFEFGLVINLLRPRVPFPDGRDDFNKIFLPDGETFTNQDYFKKMCSGYVSYFKGGNPAAYPYKKTIVMLHSMDNFQYSQYKEALIKEIQKDQMTNLKDQEFFINQKDDKISSGIYNNSNQLCNIAYPIFTGMKTETTVLKQNTNEFRKILNAELKRSSSLSLDEQTQAVLKVVGEYSSKFAKVAKLIMECPGTAFVFSNYVYYGVNGMGIIMDSIGYAAYPSRGPRGSYFIWNGEANSTHPDLVKAANKAFNSPRNVNGDVLKVMFGTQTVMEGVDFKNVNQVHILDPWWNDSRMQQVIARGIRLCSHKDLPPERRVVNVFIHLSALGSYERIYNVKVKDSYGTDKNVLSYMQVENKSNPSSAEWFISEAYAKVDKEGVADIRNSSKKFLVSQIVPGSIHVAPDQSITKVTGGWKGLDKRTVQEYMYSRALQKLNVNRKFEKVIKEVAVDCTINKNGNVVRLDEMYTPNTYIDNTWDLKYENYATGETFVRLGVKSKELPQLPDSTFTLQDILDNVSLESKSFTFENTATQQQKKIKSLIVPENIDCKIVDYSFYFPEPIVDLTMNKELMKFLFKLPERKFNEMVLKIINDSSFTSGFRDKSVVKKFKTFLSKRDKERQMYIDALKEFGFSGDEQLWDEYTTEQLKIEYNAVVKK